MKVVVLTPYRYGVAPGPRSSIELWERVLEPAGITFDYRPFETDELAEIVYEPRHYGRKIVEMTRAYGRRLRELGAIEDADAVLVYREAALIGPALIERWVGRRKPIIYQLDDPLYVPYRSPFNGVLSYLKFFGKVGSICGLSSVVIANSKHHEEYAKQHGARRVVRIPSVVDEAVFRPAAEPRTHDGPIRIGWTGSPSTVENLRLIERPLRHVLERSDAELVVVGAPESPFSSLEATVLPWSADEEVPRIASFDIGLLPLPVTPWNERSFFLKLVQYMALGVPAVATPMGSVPYVMEDGRSGFMARDEQQWERRLLQLIEDDDLRAAMSQRSRQLAAENYTLGANAERIVTAFREAAVQED